jgi:hypothetical protein
MRAVCIEVQLKRICNFNDSLRYFGIDLKERRVFGIPNDASFGLYAER